MDESERTERLKGSRYLDEHDRIGEDEKFAERICAILNDPRVDKYCMVDAYYYDFSVIPRAVKERLDLGRDCYLIFGITNEGDIVSKWVDRWDLDSPDPV